MEEGINLMQEGLTLMGAGMGVVGFFLSLMVIVMYVTSSVLRKFDSGSPPHGGLGSGEGRDKFAEIAVAIAAIKSRS